MALWKRSPHNTYNAIKSQSSLETARIGSILIHRQTSSVNTHGSEKQIKHPDKKPTPPLTYRYSRSLHTPHPGPVRRAKPGQGRVDVGAEKDNYPPIRLSRTPGQMAVAGLEAGPAGIRERSLTRPPARPPDYGHFEGEEGVGMRGRVWGLGGGVVPAPRSRD